MVCKNNSACVCYSAFLALLLPFFVSRGRVTARGLFLCTCIPVTGLFKGYLLYIKGNHLDAIATPCMLKHAEPSLLFTSLTTIPATTKNHPSSFPSLPPSLLILVMKTLVRENIQCVRGCFGTNWVIKQKAIKTSTTLLVAVTGVLQTDVHRNKKG